MQYVYRVTTTDFRNEHPELIPPSSDLPWELYGQPVADLPRELQGQSMVDHRFRILTATWRCPKAIIDLREECTGVKVLAFDLMEDVRKTIRTAGKDGPAHFMSELGKVLERHQPMMAKLREEFNTPR